MYWGAGRNSWYSGTSRCIGGIRAHLGLLRGVGGHLGCQGASGSVGGVRGVLGTSRDSRY